MVLDAAGEDVRAGRPETASEPSSVYDVRIFAAFAGLALALLVVALATVNRRPAGEVEAQSGARRSAAIISFWQEHGYFASGGMVALPAPAGERVPFFFYRSTSGGWMLPSYVFARISTVVEGRYDYVLLARFNLAVAALIAGLLGCFAFGSVLRLGVPRLRAFVLGACVQAVFFTFPDVLAFYWEPSPQTWAIGFWIVFLLLDDSRSRISGRALRAASVAQAVCAFAFVYVDYITSLLFIVAYTTVMLLVPVSRFSWRSWLLRTAIPGAAALLVFALQLTYVHHRYPHVRMAASTFMERTGLDGSTDYYRDHSDIISGRDVARRNFPYNREQLFRWPWLFVSGVAALAFLLFLHASRQLPDIIIRSLGTLTGTYLLYGAVFSQATVIHPYLFDVLLVIPIIVAVFAIVPAALEFRANSPGGFVLVALFAAGWYSMVQLRSYALWYPLRPPRAGAMKAGAPLSIDGRTWPDALPWITSPFDTARFNATTGQWQVALKNVATFAYTRVGMAMVVNSKATGTTLTSRATTLRIHLRGDAVSARRVETLFLYSADGTTLNVGQIAIMPD